MDGWLDRLRRGGAGSCCHESTAWLDDEGEAYLLPVPGLVFRLGPDGVHVDVGPLTSRADDRRVPRTALALVELGSQAGGLGVRSYGGDLLARRDRCC